MTVAELIERLKACAPDAVVLIYDDGAIGSGFLEIGAGVSTAKFIRRPTKIHGDDLVPATEKNVNRGEAFDGVVIGGNDP